jgi:hypothetical protein
MILGRESTSRILPILNMSWCRKCFWVRNSRPSFGHFRENTVQNAKIPKYEPARVNVIHENKGFVDLRSFKIHVFLNKREFVYAFSGDKIRQRSGPMRSIAHTSARQRISSTVDNLVAAERSRMERSRAAL